MGEHDSCLACPAQVSCVRCVSRGSVGPVGEKVGKAHQQMAESFEDKWCVQIWNYPHLYDVSLLLRSDKHAY